MTISDYELVFSNIMKHNEHRMDFFSSIFPKVEIKKKRLPPCPRGRWNYWTRRVFKHASFIDAYLDRMSWKKTNYCAIEGEVGDGKSNVMLYYAIRLSRLLGHRFSFKHNFSLSRVVNLNPAIVAKKFKPREIICIDEMELSINKMFANSRLVRTAIEFFDTIRELQIGFFGTLPNIQELPSLIRDYIINWRFVAEVSHFKRKGVKVLIYYRAVNQERTYFDWILFQEVWVPWVPPKIWNKYQHYKYGTYDAKNFVTVTEAGDQIVEEVKQLRNGVHQPDHINDNDKNDDDDLPVMLNICRQLFTGKHELEVLRMMAAGWSNDRMARRLGVSLGTISRVKKRVKRILDELEMEPRHFVKPKQQVEGDD